MADSRISNQPVGSRLFNRNLTEEERDILDAWRQQIPAEEVRRRRIASGGSNVPSGVRRSAAASDMQMADVPGNIPPVSPAGIRRAQEETMRIADMQAADVPGNIPASAPVGLTPPDELQQALSRARVDRQRQRNRPTTRMTPAVSEADALNQRELDRIAAARGVPGGGDIQPRELNLDERIGASMDRTLGRIGLRRTNETGEGAPSTGSFREDLRSLGRSLGLKKGGKVKKMAKGGVVKASSASRRGDGIASKGKTKGRMV